MTRSPRKPLNAESRSSNLLCLYLLFVANAVDFQKPEIVHCAYQLHEQIRHVSKILYS